MSKTPKNRVNKSAYICDHCSNKVSVLWIDNERWLICPICWPLYHIPSKTRSKLIEQYKKEKLK